jgi:hypothetical protein
MATNIVQSLFGVSPESYQQQQSDVADQRAMQYARLDPFQQANYGISRGAYGLAGAIGGALGGQDPELQRISARNSIAQQIDLNDDDSIKQGIVALNNAGDTQGAMQLQEIYLSQAKTRAETSKALRERQGADPFEQLVRTGKYTPASLAAYKESRNVGDLRTYEKPDEDLIVVGTSLVRKSTGQPVYTQPEKPDKPLAPNIKEIGVAEGSRKPVYLDVNTKQQFVFDVDASGQQVIKPFTGGVDRTTAKVSATANSTQQQQNDFAKVLNKVQGDAYSNAIDVRDNAITAVKTFNKLGELDDQGLISGSFATGRVGATNFLSTLGFVTPANVATLARSENYVKLAGDAILSALGGKLGAQISDSDREFIKSLVPQLENSAVARRQLIDYMRKKNVELIDASTELIDYAETKKTLSGYKPKIPLPNVPKGIYSNLSDEELDKKIKDLQSKK